MDPLDHMEPAGACPREALTARRMMEAAGRIAREKLAEIETERESEARDVDPWEEELGMGPPPWNKEGEDA